VVLFFAISVCFSQKFLTLKVWLCWVFAAESVWEFLCRFNSFSFLNLFLYVFIFNTWLFICNFINWRQKIKA
jgi:hypothetical protein